MLDSDGDDEVEVLESGRNSVSVSPRNRGLSPRNGRQHKGFEHLFMPLTHQGGQSEVDAMSDCEVSQKLQDVSRARDEAYDLMKDVEQIKTRIE